MIEVARFTVNWLALTRLSGAQPAWSHLRPSSAPVNCYTNHFRLASHSSRSVAAYIPVDGGLQPHCIRVSVAIATCIITRLTRDMTVCRAQGTGWSLLVGGGNHRAARWRHRGLSVVPVDVEDAHVVRGQQPPAGFGRAATQPRA